MRRALFVLAVVLGVAACGQGSSPPTLTGYGEAVYVYASSRDGGRMAELLVREGDAVVADQPLFALDPAREITAAEAARWSAQAANARAEEALADAVRRAQADLALARQNLDRTQALFERGLIARARLDADQATLRRAEAALAQARAEQAAARQEAQAASAQARLAAQRQEDIAVASPVTGRVERIYRRPGEVVAPGEPVLALLAPENMRVRFYAPQDQLTRFAPGAQVSIACDGCPDGLTGRVTYTASEPQFTPPIIYDADNRGRLVYLIEAEPSDPLAIRPGQPVDVAAP